MGGIIAGFLGGAAKGTATAGQMLLSDKLAKERDEARDMRRRELQLDIQGSRQEHLTKENQLERDWRTSERGSTQDWTSGEKGKDRTQQTSERESGQEYKSNENIFERNWKSGENTAQREWKTQENVDEREWKGIQNELDRWSAEDISEIKAEGAGNSATSQMKNVRDIMSNSNKTFTEAVALVYPGAQIQYTNVEGERMVAVVAEDGFTELGRFTETDTGKGVFVNKGEKPKRTPGVFTNAEIKAEQALLSDKNIIFDATREEARASLTKKQKAGKGGTVNAAAGIDIDRSTPKTDMPAPKKASPYKEGQVIKSKKDGKLYIIKNGKPVLKTPQ